MDGWMERLICQMIAGLKLMWMGVSLSDKVQVLNYSHELQVLKLHKLIVCQSGVPN
jgi:hypothetical protein